jgi:5-methylcytosine-specific restriction endonuclease McrA
MLSRVKDESWKEKVYKLPDDKLPEDWHELATQVKQRDHYRCQICRTSRNLTIHHKIPRDQGGTNDLYNLQTLCHSCHDKVEFGDDIDLPIEIKKVSDPSDWHTWVYGGGKNPVINLPPKP